MQALEFTRALREIKEELRVADLTALLQPWIAPGSNAAVDDGTKNRFADLLFTSNSGYRKLLGRTATRRILENLQVEQFYEPSRLRSMLSNLSSVSHAHQIINNQGMFAQFYSFAELLRSFLRMETTARQLLEDEKIGPVDASHGIVELELIEYADEESTSPARLEIFVSGIEELHTNLTLLYGLQTTS
jgi:hypothetical protein